MRATAKRKSPQLKIIRARTAHVEWFLPLFSAYLQFYKVKADHRRIRKFLRARLRRKESVVLLAMKQGKALGFTQIYPSFGSLVLRRVWILYDFFVVPDARRRGVGKALLQRARTLARRTGAHSLGLETAIDNRPAQRLYKRLGWRRDTKFYRYYLSVARKH